MMHYHTTYISDLKRGHDHGAIFLIDQQEYIKCKILNKKFKYPHKISTKFGKIIHKTMNTKTPDGTISTNILKYLGEITKDNDVVSGFIARNFRNKFSCPDSIVVAYIKAKIKFI